MKNLSLTIGWLYPELMSTYGDRGNIICLQKRCEWRGIRVKIWKWKVGKGKWAKADIIFMGGAQDKQQKIVANDFKGEKTKILKKIVENGIPGLFICGAYQFMGQYYKSADGTIIKGLGIMNHYTVHPGEKEQRLIGNIVVKCQMLLNVKCQTLVGFENHGGRTYLGKKIKPLGIVVKGFGNNGKDKTEGAIYKNCLGTYLHGPILPKNPHLADWLIKKALEIKYQKEIKLKPLEDSLEWKAHKAMLGKLKIKNLAFGKNLDCYAIK